MKFSTREDIDAPIDQVFEMLSDFDVYERNALRRGADVRRIDDFKVPAVGMQWKAAFTMRGKPRDLEITLAEYDRPNCLLFQSKSSGIEGALSMDLMALSRGRTRLSVALELKPKNLSARLLVQSLKLAKSNLTMRFKQRVADYAKVIEDRHNTAVQTH
jgi:hypothetical protein